MNKVFITMSAVLFLAACSGSDPIVVETPPPTPPPTTALDFTTFVKTELANTSDADEPVAINDLEFDFGDLDNPDAYDDLFTTP